MSTSWLRPKWSGVDPKVTPFLGSTAEGGGLLGGLAPNRSTIAGQTFATENAIRNSDLKKKGAIADVRQEAADSQGKEYNDRMKALIGDRKVKDIDEVEMVAMRKSAAAGLSLYEADQKNEAIIRLEESLKVIENNPINFQSGGSVN